MIYSRRFCHSFLIIMEKEPHPVERKPHHTSEAIYPIGNESHALSEQLKELIEKFGYLIKAALSKNTLSLYQKAWDSFERFCDSKGYQAFPTSPVALIDFAVSHATQPIGRHGRPLAMSTINTYIKAIHYKNHYLGFDSPCDIPLVKLMLKGLNREFSTDPKQARALKADEVEKMIDLCPDTLIGKRDAAILAIAFASAARRSNVRDFLIEDAEIVEKIDPTDPDRMYLHVRRSKTDQMGKGRKIPIIQGTRIQPIKRLNDWLKASGITSGYLFQTMDRHGNLRGNPLDGKDISRLVKYYAEAIGLDPSTISSHSLRAGHVTCAVIAGARDDKIMAITGHRSPVTLHRYIRDDDDFTDHASKGFI